MPKILEVSYTGDLLAHRRCPRAWAYDKQAGFHPYEQVQAMEGRLVHHAMEWLTRGFAEGSIHAAEAELRAQLEAYWRVLWGRGIRSSFLSKQDTIDRILKNLYRAGAPRPTVRAVIEGAQHTEYELRTVRKLISTGESNEHKLLLTGILDVVVQQRNPLTYERTWSWTELDQLKGEVVERPLKAKAGELEIWDYKGSRADTKLTNDYVRQLLTYARLYRERSGRMPKRCVIFYINQPEPKNGGVDKQLLAIEVNETILKAAEDWTLGEVSRLQETIRAFERDPGAIRGGRLEAPTGRSVDAELKAQCTACGHRFDCEPYKGYLRVAGKRTTKVGSSLGDVDIYNVRKN